MKASRVALLPPSTKKLLPAYSVRDPVIPNPVDRFGRTDRLPLDTAVAPAVLINRTPYELMETTTTFVARSPFQQQIRPFARAPMPAVAREGASAWVDASSADLVARPPNRASMAFESAYDVPKAPRAAPIS